MTTKTEIYEEYLLAKDKEAYLESIKTTGEYRNLLLHFCINHRKPLPEDYKSTLDLYYGDRQFALKNLLIELETTSDEKRVKEIISDINRHVLGVSFYHQRQVGGHEVAGSSSNAEQALQTKLSDYYQNYGKLSTLIQQLYDSTTNVGGFDRVGVQNLNKLDVLKLQHPESQLTLLRTLRNYLHIENIGEVLDKVKANYARHYESQKVIWNVEDSMWLKMTLDQINDAGRFDYNQSSVSWNLRKFRLENYNLLKSISSDVPEDQLRDRFLELQRVVKDQRQYTDVQRYVEKCLLIHSIKVNDIDLQSFEKFLENPFMDKLQGCFIQTVNEAIAIRGFIPINSSWNLFPWYTGSYDDRTLLSKGKIMICTNEENIKRFMKYFHESELRSNLVKYQTLNGGPIEAYQTHFGSHAANQLLNSKELLILDTNASNFENKTASISIKIRNIETLEVRQFQVDSVNFLKQNQRYPDQNMDLDGLIPEKMTVFNYTNPKHQEHTENFVFPDIDALQRGIFIIDFVGGGLMSRAVIKKGTLSLLSQPDEYGHRFYILDSNKKVCSGENTGIFVDGKFIPSDANGQLIIPYDKDVFSKQAVLIHDNFGYLANITVPRENYRLSNALLFNDEGILPGKKATILIRSRLFLNDVSVSLKKLKEVNVILSTSTLDNITNTKVYDNVAVEDGKDYSIEFLVPNKLTSFNIQLSAKVETVGSGDVPLSYSESISVNRGEYEDTIAQGFFTQDGEKHFFHLKGRNGEPLAKQPVVITIKRLFDSSTTNETVYTDSNGQIELGPLENISSVNGQYNGKSLATKIIDTGRVDMPTSYSICVGEDLVIPSRSLALNKENFSLVQEDYQNGGILKDCFGLIKTEGDDIVLSGLEEGDYSLTYNAPSGRDIIGINVLKANRWESSELFLETKDELRSSEGELRFISVQNFNVQGSNLSLQICSNDLENTVVHILGYNFNPVLADFISDQLSATTSKRRRNTYSIARTSNIFISGKNLGDEMNYVLDRKNKKNFIGNTLKKPSILLHRKFIRETTEDEEKLKSETNFDASTMSRGMAREMASGEMYSMKRMAYDDGRYDRGGSYGFQDYQKNFQIYANCEYITESGLTIANLKPDQDGRINIPVSQLGNYSKFVVFASDTFGHVIAKQYVKPTSIVKADLRLSESKSAGIIYTEDRFCLPVAQGASATVKDLKNCQVSFLETQQDLLDALLVITECDKGSLTDWKFLATWGNLSDEEKLKKFDKFGGDELNVFTYIKDRQFFNTHILPILRFKSESRLIDYILTKNEEHLEKAFSLHGASNLTPLEIVLLLDHYKESKPQLCKQIVTSLENKLASQTKNESQKNSWLDSIIASKKVEEEESPEDYEGGGGGGMELCDDGIAYASMPMMRVQQECCMDMCEAMPSSECEQQEEKKSVMRKRSRAPMAPLQSRGGMLSVGHIMAESKPVEIERYKKAGAAFEYGERHQFFDGSLSKGEINDFWFSIMQNVISGKGNQILSENFVYSSQSNYGIVYGMTFTNLPFVKGSLTSKTIEKDLEVSSTQNFLVLVKKMEEKTTDPLNLDIIISQKFYDPNEKYTYDETDYTITTVKEVNEFLIGKIYESQITFTNISENQLKLKVIQQIPQGSMPVYELDDLKIHDQTISGLQTSLLTFKFYFPYAGNFSCYPATITKNNRFIAHSNIAASLKVVEKFERGDKVLGSLQDILNYGSQEDILNFMREKNLFNVNIFQIQQVLWILQDEKYYTEAIKILRDKCFYDPRAWEYSLKYGDLTGFEEWTRNTQTLNSYLSQFKYFKNKFANIDTFKPLEYDPLINARAHSLSEKKQNILNKDFRTTYENFLAYCVERPELGSRERIIFTAYLTLQDRIEEALVFVKTINEVDVRSNNIMVVQYDYLKAYLSIFEEYPTFTTARDITKNYLQFPDLSWRKMFIEIANQLAEYDGAQTIEIEEDPDKVIKHASNKEQSQKAEYLKVEHKEQATEFVLTYMNLDQVTVSFFKLNMEILFSKDPFLDKNINNFSFINPNFKQVISLPAATDFSNHTIAIPAELQSSSLFVHIQGKSKNATLKIFNSDLRVHAIEDFGLLKITDKQGKILNSIYVKCYFNGTDGETKFYKDGYSDFRGSFDYASLNSNSLEKVKTFALLVTDAKYGSTILKVGPPKKVGTIA